MIEPAGHRVLVRVKEFEKVTKGGIIVPGSVQEMETQAGIYGTIVAVGMNAWKAFDGGEPWAKVGDEVAFTKYGGAVIKDPDTEELFRILNDDEIIAVVR